MPIRRAYRTYVNGIELVVFAESRGKARAYAMLAAHAELCGVDYLEVGCWRAKDLDGTENMEV